MGDGPVLGIDLGTTNSVVAVADGGQARVLTDDQGRRMVPSVVAFMPDGETLVGYDARERRLVDARNTVYAVKRLIGRPFDSPEVARARERFAFEIVANKHGGSVVKVGQSTYALAEISAMVLRELRRIAELNLGESVERAVITVPANFNELQRSATKAAGKVAGLDVLRIVNEPTAAALAYGYAAGQNERIGIYDLGGGTFDITILELERDVFEVLSTAGDTFLGGEDLDRAVAEVMSDRFREQHGIDPRKDAQAFERLKAAAEWAKCQLSSEEAVELTVEELIVDSRGKAYDLTFAMTRPELEALVRPWLVRSIEVCETALEGAGMKAKDLDRLVLVGGSTRIPLCRQMVADYFGREPRIDLDPDMVVAQGAAIHGYALGGAKAPSRPPKAPPIPLHVALGRATLPGVARHQPAFGPEERVAPPPPPERAAKPTPPPAPMPDLPVPQADSAVVVAKTVAVRTPKTSMDFVLDELAPPPPGPDTFPPEGDPFASPRSGSRSERLPMPDLEAPLDAPFAVPPAGQKRVSTREPTAPFALETHAAKKMPAPPPPSMPMPVVPMPERAPPLLMDVTPHSLGVETAGGYCKKLITKNAPVPTEQTRTFTTARDDQEQVSVRVCQGESDLFAQNQELGEILLDQLPRAARGSLDIEVVFILDADGTLAVTARDAQSGRTQHTRINLRGGLSAEEIETMRARQQGMRA